MKYGTVKIDFFGKVEIDFFLKLSQTHFNLGLIKFIIKTIKHNNKVLLFFF